METEVLDRATHEMLVDLSFAIDDPRLVGEIQKNSRDRDWCANEILDSLAKEEKGEYWEEQRHCYHHIALVALHRCVELQRKMDEFLGDNRDALLNAVVVPVATAIDNSFTENVPQWMLLEISSSAFRAGIDKLAIDEQSKRALLNALNGHFSLPNYQEIFCDSSGLYLKDFSTWCGEVLSGEIDLLEFGDIGFARRKEITWACWQYLHDGKFANAYAERTRNLLKTRPASANK